MENIGKKKRTLLVTIGTVSSVWILLAIVLLIWWYRKKRNSTDLACEICENPSQLFKQLPQKLVNLVKAKLAFDDTENIKK